MDTVNFIDRKIGVCFKNYFQIIAHGQYLWSTAEEYQLVALDKQIITDSETRKWTWILCLIELDLLDFSGSDIIQMYSSLMANK